MVMEATTVTEVLSESILLEAVEVWKTAKQEYRDAALRVGRLLSDYVIARLQEADDLPEVDRINRNLTRERSIEDAAGRLHIKVPQANMMLRIAKVVELFGDPGELSYSTIRAFVVLIQRKKCVVARGRKTKKGQVKPSESEQWEIKPTTGSDPLELYKRAVTEGWDSVYTKEIITGEVGVKRHAGRPPKAKPARRKAESVRSSRPHKELVGERLPTLTSISEKADPRDVADMILEIISACPRSNELKQILREMIS